VIKKLPKVNNCLICRRNFAQSGHPEWDETPFEAHKEIKAGLPDSLFKPKIAMGKFWRVLQC
jgi:hypothetical protein